MPTNVYDQAARYAAKLDPTGFLAWLLAGIWHLVEFAGWLDTRTLPYPGERDRTCDTVAHLRERAPSDGPPARSWATVVEFQTRPEPSMLERSLEYVLRIRRELRPGEDGPQQYEVAAVVVNLTGRRQPDRWTTGLPTPSEAALTWSVEVRTMAEEDAAGLLAEIEAGRVARCLLPWIPLMRGADDPRTIDEWKRIAAAEPDSRRRSDYGALALIFAELSGRQRLWKDALKGWNMQESPQVLEWQEEARREGRDQAIRENLLEALEVRFGAEVPEDLRSRIEAQSDRTLLSRWFRLALTAEDLDEFRQGL